MVSVLPGVFSYQQERGHTLVFLSATISGLNTVNPRVGNIVVKLWSSRVNGGVGVR